MSTVNLTKVTVAKFALALVIVAGLIAGGFAAFTLSGNTPVAAAPTFTGDVEADFPDTDPDVIIIEDAAPVGDVGVPSDASFTSGWDMRDVRVYYDAATDELFVGMNFDGVGGDANGDGDPNSGLITNTTAGGTDVADFGIDEAFSVIFDIDQDGIPDLIAGVHDFTDISGFAVATASDRALRAPESDLSYVTVLPGNTGVVPNNTSLMSPDIEFSITDFSTIVPGDTSPSFALSAFAGSFADGGIGEEFVSAQRTFTTVELFTPAPALELQKLTNGIDADTAADAPTLIVGSTVTFTYEVTNTGNVPLIDVAIDDSVLGPDVCIIAGPIAVGDTASCEATATVTAGDYMNVGTATGQGTDPDGNPVGNPVSAEDPSHHIGGAAAIDIEKTLDGADVDEESAAVAYPVGATITFDFKVTNTGSFGLTGVAVTDDVLGAITCPKTTLDVFEMMMCTADHVVTDGLTKNIASVSGQPIGTDGNPIGDPVTDEDPAHHLGVANGIDIEKTLFGVDLDEPGTNPGDVPNLPVGVTITFDFIVTNTGVSTIDNIVVTDSVIAAVNCPQTSLAFGASMTCTADHVVTEGLTKNIGTVVGQPVDQDGNPIGDPVTDEDPAHHRGIANTIDLEKATNGEDADDTAGPNIALGDPVTFTYVVTNTSPLPLADVVVTDDVEGQICTIALLPFGGSETCELTTTAGLGAYENNSDVVGQPVDADGAPLGPPITDSDPSHHFGECKDVVEGPALWLGAETVWDTGLIAGDNSTIQIITSENGASPAQPNEQVYIEIAGVQYGPTPQGLGVFTFDVATGGPVTILHISEVDSSITGSNSVVPALCGTDLTLDIPLCVDLVEGPPLYVGSEVVWDTGLTAATGSEIRIVTSENGASPAQPNEQVYIEIAGVQYGPTPAGLGELEFTVGEGGPVTIIHYSEVTGDTSSPNSVVPAICGTDLTVNPGPVCVELIEGPALYVGSQLVWDTGLVAEAGQPIRLVTSENGASPAQPNEQVYVKIGDETYGPSPAGLGELTFTPTVSGPVSVLHYSVVSGDTSSPNSVVPALCGPGLGEPAPVCTEFVEGPALYVGSDTVWHTSHYAKDNSQLRVMATENGASPDQPNEKFFVQVNGVTIGMSPTAPGEATFDIVDGGLVTIVHYSVVTGDTSSPNSVVPSICGTDLVKIEGGLSCELPDGTAVEIPVDGSLAPASFDWSSAKADAEPTWYQAEANSSAAWMAKRWERPVIEPDHEA